MLPTLEEVAAHNSAKIQRLFLAKEISALGAVSFLEMICDLDECVAEHIVFTWSHPNGVE